MLLPVAGGGEEVAHAALALDLNTGLRDKELREIRWGQIDLTPLPKDPTRAITSFKTAWSKVRQKAGVKGRWHDNAIPWLRNTPNQAPATR